VFIKRPPNVETISIQFVGNKIYLEGNIVSNGGSIIQEYGFEIKGTNNILEIQADGLDEEVGFFNKVIDNIFIEEITYTVAAYIKVNGKIFYGAVFSFDGLAKSKPILISFEPHEGKVNDFVKIYGSNFSSHLKIFFDDLEAEIEEQTFDMILVKVPFYKDTKPVAIIVKDGNSIYSIDGKFNLLGPIVLELLPSSNKERVTIIGKNFSPLPWRNTVKIGRYSTKVEAATTTSLIIKFDFNKILPGSYPISVSSDGILSNLNINYNIASSWGKLKTKPDGGVAYSASFEIDGIIYTCGGYSPTQLVRTSEVWAYDIKGETWTRMTDFPGGSILSAVGFTINGKGYVGTGSGPDGFGTSDFWEYDPSIDQWIKKSNFPGGGREGAVGFAFNGKGYVGLGGGGGSTRSVRDIWEFNPVNNSWSQLPDFAGDGRVGAKGVIFNNKIFIIGGADANSSFEPDTWSFEPLTNTWVNHGLNKFDSRGVFFDGTKCYILEVVSNFYFEFEMYIREYNPDLNEITNREFPIFPAGTFPGLGVRGVPVITTMHDKTLYIGLGPVGGNFECLDDLWKIKID